MYSGYLGYFGVGKETMHIQKLYLYLRYIDRFFFLFRFEVINLIVAYPYLLYMKLLHGSLKQLNYQGTTKKGFHFCIFILTLVFLFLVFIVHMTEDGLQHTDVFVAWYAANLKSLFPPIFTPTFIDPF